ncbi:hypothetical protein PQH03_17395 [Ralstonia insidiosa]|nr:hypothetical protein [Ralstonia insidiosa]MDE4926406.1 hypothetical protein [Ralstonia insidiosa]
MDRLNHFIEEYRVVVREGDIQTLDRINDSQLLFGREMETGSGHD